MAPVHADRASSTARRRTRLCPLFAAVLIVSLMAPRARAELAGEEDETIVLRLADGLPLDPGVVRQALEERLEAPVVLDTDPRARSARRELFITPFRGRNLMFAYRSPQGRIWRIMELDEDPSTALTDIACLAQNLVAEFRFAPPKEIREVIIVPPRPPPPAPPPIRQARERSFTDDWAVGLLAVEVFTASSAATRVGFQLSHRWGALAVGASADVGFFSARTPLVSAIIGHYSLQAEVEYRRSFTWAIAELGLAVGIRLHHLTGQRGETVELSPVGRLQLSIVVPIARNLDLVVRSEVATTFVDVEFSGLYRNLPLSLWEIGLGAGLRLHL